MIIQAIIKFEIDNHLSFIIVQKHINIFVLIDFKRIPIQSFCNQFAFSSDVSSLCFGWTGKEYQQNEDALKENNWFHNSFVLTL